MAERNMSEASSFKSQIPVASFPMYNSPQVWFLTSALSPLAVRLMRVLLAHGDCVAAGLPVAEIEDEERSAEFEELMSECKGERKDREGWEERLHGIKCDGRVIGQCGAAVAEVVETFGRIDILLCSAADSVVGTVEELSTSEATQNLVRDQFEINFFSQLNFIKATLPLLREKHNGHIIIVTSITGHIGTPGMSMYCASNWALEGYCDSLAYEIAPFNIKLTIVQPNKEIALLSNKIIFAPPLPQYSSQITPAPAMRNILTNALNSHPSTKMPESGDRRQNENSITSRYPKLPSEARDIMVMETVHALTAIGGHENPPARHIVGFEGVASVKEKLKAVSEELEDFVEVSYGVDIFKSDAVRIPLITSKVNRPAGNSRVSFSP